MSEINLEETRPIPTSEEPQGERGRSTWWIWILVGFLGLLVLATLGGYGGYLTGIQDRLDVEATTVAGEAQEQYQLGIRDMEAGLYDVARQRFEYVIQLNPNYPGVTERLAEVLLALNVTATATAVPTATLTPTQDLRDAQDLYFQAEQLLGEENWTAALETLDTLRQREPTFQAVAVDGMYYVALRNRGVFKISGEGNLEGGMYDLSRAELFGPLDKDSEAWRIWARLYVAGASFWDVNWGQVVAIFSDLVAVAPNIRDSGNWTARERLRQGLIAYGDQWARQNDWCTAQQQYEAAFQLGPDPELEPRATEVAEECSKPKEDEENKKKTERPPGEGESTPLPPTQNSSSSGS
jgi:tetratricopeptide (TPR) repeat protein